MSSGSYEWGERLWRCAGEPDTDSRTRSLCLSLRAMGSKSASSSFSANMLSSISLAVRLRNFGFFRRSCLRIGRLSSARRDRGICTRDRETSRIVIVVTLWLSWSIYDGESGTNTCESCGRSGRWRQERGQVREKEWLGEGQKAC